MTAMSMIRSLSDWSGRSYVTDLCTVLVFTRMVYVMYDADDDDDEEEKINSEQQSVEGGGHLRYNHREWHLYVHSTLHVTPLLSTTLSIIIHLIPLHTFIPYTNPSIRLPVTAIQTEPTQ